MGFLAPGLPFWCLRALQGAGVWWSRGEGRDAARALPAAHGPCSAPAAAVGIARQSQKWHPLSRWECSPLNLSLAQLQRLPRPLTCFPCPSWGQKEKENRSFRGRLQRTSLAAHGWAQEGIPGSRAPSGLLPSCDGARTRWRCRRPRDPCLALPSLSDSKPPLICPRCFGLLVSLAFHPSYLLSPTDYSIPLAFPLFCSFCSIIGSFAVYRKDEKQKVLTTWAFKIICQAQKKEMKRKSGSSFFAFWFLNLRSSLVSCDWGFSLSVETRNLLLRRAVVSWLQWWETAR